MIEQFTMNKETGTAFFMLAGKGFHHDLHRLCTVVSKEDRKFEAPYWRVRHAREYAEKFSEQWPEFTAWVHQFENQLELGIVPRSGLVNGTEKAQI